MDDAEAEKQLSAFSTAQLVREVNRRERQAHETLRVIQNNAKETPPSKRNSDAVLSACEDYYGVPHEAIIGNDRVASIVRARHTAMYLLCVWCGLGPSGTASIFSKDHASVCYAIAKISDALERDVVFAEELNEIKRKIGVTGVTKDGR